MGSDRERLRTGFTNVADLYDRARPSYPPELIQDLIVLSEIKSGSRVLEVGPGTGQLTVPLARLGIQIVSVELGHELAEVARRNLAAFQNVVVPTDKFEEWLLPSQLFDAVVFATSFHWVDPEIRYWKAAEALRERGVLVIVTTHHVAGGDIEFFERVQRCYEEHMPGTPKGLRLPEPRDVESRDPLLEASKLFGRPEVREYVWETSYTALKYQEVLMTYSGHLDLALDERQKLLDCIAKLIDSAFGGSIRKAYLNRLFAARRI